MSKADAPCVVCGRKPAAGWAWIGDDRYCHGDFDSDPTCYMRGTWGATEANEWTIEFLRPDELFPRPDPEPRS